MSEDILEFLRENGIIPSRAQEKESTKKKREVFNKICTSLEDWASKRLNEKNLPGEVLAKKHVSVLVSGSVALGLKDCDSDVDLVCMCSNLLERSDFFRHFRPSAELHAGARNFQSLPTNRCPIFKMTVDDIKVDLSISITKKPHLGDVTFRAGDDDDLREGMDEESIISFNGPKNMAAIKKMVPDLELYRSVLSSVKCWAKRRLVYSSSIGYFGGAAYAVTVAYVCCKHGGLTQLMTLKKFFEIFSEWPWPKPVLLKELTNKKSLLHPWNPEDDSRHLTPVILPCFPEVNCAYNVHGLSKSSMTEEFRRGKNILQDAYEAGPKYLELFNAFDFFAGFRTFLVIVFRSRLSTEIHSSWCGLVETRIRFLSADLSETRAVGRARIFPERFLYSGGDGRFLTEWFVGLEIQSPGGGGRLDVSIDVERFKSFVYGRSAEYGWKREGTELEVINLTRSKGDASGSGIKSYLPEAEKHFHLIRGPSD